MEDTDGRKRRQTILRLVDFLDSGENGDNITKRAWAVGELEKLTGMNFKTSKQFDEAIVNIRYKMALAQRLEEVRLVENMSVKELAKHLKTSVDRVEQMERGSRSLDSKALKFIGEDNEEEDRA